MNVNIDGVEYAPRHKAEKGGRIKSVAQLFTGGRKHMSLTLEQARQQSGVTISKLVGAENGTTSLETALLLARFYGIPLDQLARSVLRTASEAAGK
jgi:transcriptional regulator with XRE-family HTH domain